MHEGLGWNAFGIYLSIFTICGKKPLLRGVNNGGNLGSIDEDNPYRCKNHTPKLAGVGSKDPPNRTNNHNSPTKIHARQGQNLRIVPDRGQMRPDVVLSRTAGLVGQLRRCERSL